MVLLNASPSSGNSVSDKEFETLILMANRNFEDRTATSMKSGELETFAYRRMWVTSLFNERISNMAARNHIIFCELAYQKDTLPPFNLKQSFELATCVPFDHYSDVGMAIASTFASNGVVRSNYFHGQKRKELDLVFDSFFRFNSISVERFRQIYDDDPFALPPFFIHPIVDLGDSKYICPIVRVLIQRSFDLYHIFFTSLRTSFSDWYGLVLQRYVGKLLEQFFDRGAVLPEITYGKNQGKSVDWLVREGKVLLLFECKNKRLHYTRTIKLGDLEQLQTDIEGAIARSVSQLQETVDLISNKQPEFAVVFGTKEIIACVVLPEFPYENSLSVRRRVNEIIKQSNQAGMGLDYQVIELGDLERILPYRDFKKGRLLRNLIKEKMCSNDFRFRSFNDLVAYRYSRRIPRNVYLDTHFEQVQQNALEKFFGAKKPPTQS